MITTVLLRSLENYNYTDFVSATISKNMYIYKVFKGLLVDLYTFSYTV